MNVIGLLYLSSAQKHNLEEEEKKKKNQNLFIARITDVSVQENAKTIVIPGRRCLQHTDSAASQILNAVQVRFQILELHHHQPHFHYHTLQLQPS